MTDGYYPPDDEGLLWVRSFDGKCMVSGFVRKHVAPTSDDLDRLIDQIQEMLPLDNVQPVCNIKVIGATRSWNRQFNGEDLDTTY